LNNSGIALAAIEQGERVPARAQRVDEMRTDETGSAQDQHAQRLSSASARPPSSNPAAAAVPSLIASRLFMTLSGDAFEGNHER